MPLTTEHLDIMRHSLGTDRQPTPYRNYFCAEDGHSDMPLIRDLMEAGCMRLSHRINQGRDGIYVVTDKGISALAVSED